MHIPARLLSFKVKALLALGILQVLGLLALGFLTYEQSQRILVRLAQDKLSLAMERVSSDLTNYVRDESRLVMLLSQMPPIQILLQVRDQGGRYPEGEALYKMWRRQLEEVFLATAALHLQCLDLLYLDDGGQEIVRVRAEGGLRSSLDHSVLKNRASAPYFHAASRLDSGRVYVSPLSLRSGTVGSRPTFWVATPVFDARGTRRGVLALHIDIEGLLSIIKSPFEQGRAYLVDQRGQVLYRSDGGGGSQVLHLEHLHPRLAAELASSESGNVYAACEMEAQMDGAAGEALCLHGFGKVRYDPQDEQNFWAAVFDAPPELITAPTLELRNRFLLLGGLVVGLSLALGFFLLQSMVVEPVLHLERAAERIAGGDLSPEIAPYDRRDDEIGQLYTSFNTMVGKLRQATEHLQEEVQARTAELRASEEQLERQNEELERLSAYKSHLLSVVSHELKTPLTSLDGFGRIVNQMFLTDEFLAQFEGGSRETLDKVRQRIEIMGHNTTRLIRLVNDLLDFSRIDQGRGLEMQRRLVDLSEVVDEVVESYRELGAKRGLALRYEGALELRGLQVWADGDRIAQVLNNLLSNALKFTDEGEGIRLEVQRLDQYLEFRVYDSGAGIDAGALERIFELFEQAGGRIARGQGTGIGLAISRYIVERHGGYIRAESEGVGRGSCFIFGIPRRKERAEAAGVALWGVSEKSEGP